MTHMARVGAIVTLCGRTLYAPARRALSYLPPVCPHCLGTAEILYQP